MNFPKSYKAQQKNFWQGRVDDPDDVDSYRWHQKIELLDLAEDNPKVPNRGLSFCFLGYCCDKGVGINQGRKGAAKAPESIRKELANLPVGFGENPRILDAGDLYCSNQGLEESQAQLAYLVERIVHLGHFPIILGGGHEIAFGHYNGLIQGLLSKGELTPQLGIINFDAHFDLRPYLKGSHSGSMFLQIADQCRENNLAFSYFCLGIQKYGNTISLFKKADELGAHYVLAKDIDQGNIPRIKEKLDSFLEANHSIYLTICADVFSSAFAPGVSAPQPFGLHPELVLKLIKHILKSGKVIGFDIAEVSPRFDEDNRTAKLVAIIIFALVNTLSETTAH